MKIVSLTEHTINLMDSKTQQLEITTHAITSTLYTYIRMLQFSGYLYLAIEQDTLAIMIMSQRL